MEKRYKNDYFRDMVLMTKECIENLTAAEKFLTGQFTDNKNENNNNSVTINKIKLQLDKDYFTPIEREDIFSICCHLYELNEATLIFFAIAKENNVFLFTEEFILTTNLLINMTKTLFEIITSLSKYPKHNDLSSLFIKSEEQYSKLKKRLINESKKSYNYIFSVMEKCVTCCHTTVTNIQYVLIKNS